MNYQELTRLADYCGLEGMKKLKAIHDAENIELLAKRQANLDSLPGIRIGDFVISGDNVARVAHHWGDAVQLSAGGSYYFCNSGHCSMSGSLDPGIDVNLFQATNETRKGSVWFFSRDHSMAHNGYYCEAVFKVWRLPEGMIKNRG